VPKRKLEPRGPKKHAARSARARSSTAARARLPVADIAPSDKPQWDEKEHTLIWRGQVVKHYKADAPFQEAVFAAFQVAGWPSCVRLELVARNGLGKDRLRDTIRNVNRSVHRYLRFRLEGNGTRICWERR
jgi:hypothetical protein